MDERIKRFYEGQSHERLHEVLSYINGILSQYGGLTFEKIINRSNQVISHLVWDGYQTIYMQNLIAFLNKLVTTLVKTESILNPNDYQKISLAIEPLQIIISELMLAYEENKS